MPSDGELLTLLHGALGRVESLTARARHWSHAERMQLAFAAAGSMVGHHQLYRRPEQDEVETISTVAYAAGGRFREELLAGPAHRPTVTASDGTRTVDVFAERITIRPSRGCWLIERMLDPSWVLTHDLEVVGDDHVGRRATLIVRATARDGRTRSGGAVDMAGQREIVVDAERGLLHRHTALIDGLPYDETELTDVELDGAIDPEVFTPEIPEGIEVSDFAADPPAPSPWGRQPDPERARRLPGLPRRRARS